MELLHRCLALEVESQEEQVEQDPGGRWKDRVPVSIRYFYVEPKEIHLHGRRPLCHQLTAGAPLAPNIDYYPSRKANELMSVNGYP
jgi:hypothetical protein